MYQFLMPIGDWSNDGHGKCKYFLVESNKAIEEVREIHQRIIEVTGVDIQDICSEYEENDIFDYKKEMLDHAGVDTSMLKVSKYNEDKFDVSPENMAQIWISLLMKTDCSLVIGIKLIPEMTFACVGYGVC